MSLAEKMYLSMVLFVFLSFMVLMATMCWLDGKDDRIGRRRLRTKAIASKPDRFSTSSAVPQH
jgi:hypothetical protein